MVSGLVLRQMSVIVFVGQAAGVVSRGSGPIHSFIEYAQCVHGYKYAMNT